jgi:hypothetical protein
MLGGALTMEGTVVRDTMPDTQGALGRGVDVQPLEAERATLAVRGCVLERSTELGMFVDASDVTIESSIVRGTLPTPTGAHGAGLHFQTGATATIRTSLVDQNVEFGVQVIDSDVTIESSEIRNSTARADHVFGDGVAVTAADRDASARLVATRIEDSARAAVTSFGAEITLQGNALACQAFDLDGEPLEHRMHQFLDLGGNGCGCPVANAACVLVSAAVAPPEPLPPATSSEPY